MLLTCHLSNFGLREGLKSYKVSFSYEIETNRNTADRNHIIIAAALTATFAQEVLFDNSEDEYENHEKERTYAEKIVPNMSDNQFKIHFRMNGATFENLLNKICRVAKKDLTAGQPQIALDKQLMVVIWYLANLESFR